MAQSQPLVGKRKLHALIQKKQLELLEELIENCKSLEELNTAVKEYNRLYNDNIQTTKTTDELKLNNLFLGEKKEK